MLEASGIGFAWRRGDTPVLDDVGLRIAPGEIVGLDGTSGGGKTTLARLLAAHLPLQRGRVTVDGAGLPKHGYRPVQLLCQAPELATNPRLRIGRVLQEAWAPTPELAAAMGVREAWAERFPHELSGGELQRVCILRALGPRTRYLVADEITSMLDAITQLEIWRALLRLVESRALGILAISHDAHLLRRVATRRLRLDAGRLVPG